MRGVGAANTVVVVIVHQVAPVGQGTLTWSLVHQNLSSTSRTTAKCTFHQHLPEAIRWWYGSPDPICGIKQYGALTSNP